MSNPAWRRTATGSGRAGAAGQDNDRRPRLALVVPAFHSDEADPFVPYWRHYVTALARRADVTVIALRGPSRRPYRLFGAQVTPVGRGNPRLRSSPPLWAAASGRIAAVDKVRPFDAIQALTAGEAGFVAALGARRLGRPLAVHVSGGELIGLPDVGYGGRLSSLETWQTRMALRSAGAVTGGSRIARRLIRAQVGTRIPVLPLTYGVDPGQFSSPPEPPKPAVAHVGDLVTIKDQALLLTAFAAVAGEHRRLELHLVGDGPRAGHLRNLAHQLGIQASVRWWGAVPHSAVHLAYRRASVYLHSSRHEAQGVVFLEALATGMAVASTAVGLAPELPEPGVFLAPPGDPGALAACLARALALASAEGWAATRSGLRAFALAHTWEATVDQAARAFTAAGMPGAVLPGVQPA